MRRGILAAVGSHVTNVVKLRCTRLPIEITPSIDRFRRRVVGRTIEKIGRAGKRVVIHLNSGDAIVIEPRMAGLVLVGDAPTQEHLRFRIELSGGVQQAIDYWDRRGLGNVRLLSSEEVESQLGPSKLGPDALVITAELYREKLASSQREIKVALLDQRAVAGIGNIYAAEILHLIGVHPRRKCCDISKREWSAMADATHDVLNAAIRFKGSTLTNGLFRDASNKKGGYQKKHLVYGREGKPCTRCKRGTVERIVQAQRSTFFCAKCQK